MKNALLVLAVTVLAVPALPLQARASGSATAAMCQPLTGANLARCCSARNRDTIILPQDIDLCLDTRLRKEAALQSPSPPDDGGDTPNPPSGPTRGNPGNDKAVGQSGEKGMDNESPRSGTRGNSN